MNSHAAHYIMRHYPNYWRVLDFGAGELHDASMLHAHGVSVTCVETPARVEELLDKAVRIGLPLVDWDSYHDTPDVVLCSKVLCSVSRIEQEAILRAIVTLPARHFVFEVTSSLNFPGDKRNGKINGVYRYGFSIKDLVELVQNHGLLVEGTQHKGRTIVMTATHSRWP